MAVRRFVVSLERLVLAVILGSAAWGIYKVTTEPVLVAVRARSEVVRLRLGSTSSRNTWYLRNALVKVDTHKSRKFTGELSAAPGASVGFQRLGSDSLTIAIEAPPGATDAGRLYAGAEETGARQRITVAMSASDARNLVFPFSGTAIVGAMVGLQNGPGSPLLLEGTAELIARTPFSESHFVAGTTSLLEGDEIEIVRDTSKTFEAGFLRVDDGKGILVAIDAPGTGVRTRRFLSADATVVEKPFLPFFEHDGWLGIIVAASALIVHALVSEYTKGRIGSWIKSRALQADSAKQKKTNQT